MHRAILFCALFTAASVCLADSRPPPTKPVGSSTDGRFIVRLSSKIQVFALEKDEKGYRLVSEIDPASEGSPLKALISDDGRFVVTLDGGRGMGRGRDVVAVFESGGKKLKEWSLSEILEKGDLDAVVSSVSSTWWRKEVLIAGRRPLLIVTGPDDQISPVKRRYWYELDLEALKWTKRR